MKNDLIFMDEEFKDALYTRSTIKFSFWMRLSILFSRTVSIDQTIYCREVMPSHKAGPLLIHSYDLIDIIRSLFRKKQGGMEAPTDEVYTEDNSLPTDN